MSDGPFGPRVEGEEGEHQHFAEWPFTTDEDGNAWYACDGDECDAVGVRMPGEKSISWIVED